MNAEPNVTSPTSRTSAAGRRVEAEAQTVSNATKHLLDAAARRRAAGMLSSSDVILVRRVLKRARRAKTWSPSAASAFIVDTERLARALDVEAPASDRPPALPPPPAQRVDELPQMSLAAVELRHRLVCLVDGGRKTADAVAELGWPFAERTARDIVARYRAGGFNALVDGRCRRRVRPRPKMTSAVESLVFGVWMSFPAAAPKAVWREVVKRCEDEGLPQPGYHSVYHFLQKQPRDLQLLRVGKLEVIKKEMRSVVRVTRSRRANERFQMDHTRLDLWVKEEIDGQLRACNAWCTAVLDEFSRTIAGFIISTEHPNAWTVALALRHAILPKRNPAWLNKGIPTVLQIDNGKDFTSSAIATSCAAMRIVIQRDPPYHPDSKGKIERWFGTLKTSCLRTLPGHMEAIGVTEAAAQRRVASLFTLPQLRAEIERWIVTEYHARSHRELGESPNDCWLQSIGVPRLPDDESSLALLLMQTDERIVQNVGIEFRGNRYFAPALRAYAKARVRLRFNPDELGSILVYSADSGEYLCEAHSMGHAGSRYGSADVRRADREYYAGLVERVNDHMELVAREGRSQAAVDESRRLLTKLAEPPVPAMSGLDREVEELKERLERAQSEGATYEVTIADMS